MDDLALVDVLKGLYSLCEEAVHQLWAHLVLPDVLEEVATLGELEDQVYFVVLQEVVVELDDVGVVQHNMLLRLLDHVLLLLFPQLVQVDFLEREIGRAHV